MGVAMRLVRICASVALALLVTKTSAQTTDADELLLYHVDCKAKSARELGENDFVVGFYWANKSGQKVRVYILFLDGNPNIVETLYAEKDEPFKTRLRLSVDNPKNDGQRYNVKATFKVTDPIYEGYCLGKGEGEPFKTQFTLDSNRIDLLAAGVALP